MCISHFKPLLLLNIPHSDLFSWPKMLRLSTKRPCYQLPVVSYRNSSHVRKTNEFLPSSLLIGQASNQSWMAARDWTDHLYRYHEYPRCHYPQIYKITQIIVYRRGERSSHGSLDLENIRQTRHYLGAITAIWNTSPWFSLHLRHVYSLLYKVMYVS